MNKERIERIEEMEKHLDEASKAIRELSDALTKYEWARDDYYKLQEYYDSELWLRDFEADEAGELPKDLKRGVLSEDTVYDLITEHERLLERLEEASLYESATEEPV
ncbi:MAG: DUF4298 domain-containing protein [Clostridiales bacterium]|nr:DUF4298 domain-containing protein [Clostridiales bacterium]